jgi:hypothetical protein
MTVVSRFHICRTAQISGLLILMTISFALVGGSATSDSAASAGDVNRSTQEKNGAEAPSISSYPARQTKADIRVSLLGITKGVAFLKSQAPAADGDREYGNNAVPWLRVSVLVEMLGDNPAPLGPYSYELQTSEGEELVDKIRHRITVKGEPILISGRSRGVAESDVDHAQLSRQLFPTAVPEVENPKQSKVFQITVSGRFRKTPTTTLLLNFRKEGDEQKFVFNNIPLP